jgi:iron complex transport system permease protein
MKRIPFAFILVGLAAALMLASTLGLATGAVPLSLRDLVASIVSLMTGGDGGVASTILLELRLPRAILVAVVGASLAVSGAAFQGFFRNPLADPYVIGASSGAALGAALAIIAALPSFGPLSAPALTAFVGALCTTFLAFAVARAAGNPPPAAALLLAGSALSSLCSAGLAFALAIRDRDLHRVYYWLLGGFGGTTWSDVVSAVPIMAVGCLVVFIASRPLDLLAFGEDAADSLGLDVKRARLVVAVGASLAAAAAVSAAGVIGFVGLVAPHAVRLLVGPGHRRLIPASALAGALLVTLADIVARIAAAPIELPVGVVTSVIGAPFFIYLLVKFGRRAGYLR